MKDFYQIPKKIFKVKYPNYNKKTCLKKEFHNRDIIRKKYKKQ